MAWYDDDGEPTNHNPFKKFRARPRQSGESRLESGLHTVRTADHVSTEEERRRRIDVTGGLSGPQHADTLPAPDSAGTDHTRAAEENPADKNGLEQSVQSHEPINLSSTQSSLGEGKPRRRKLFAKFTDKDSDTLAPSKSRESVPNKQKFTVVGQLKATIFNSWINILLGAAPAGSKILLPVSSCILKLTLPVIINYLHVDPTAVFVVNFIAIM